MFDELYDLSKKFGVEDDVTFQDLLKRKKSLYTINLPIYSAFHQPQWQSHLEL